MAGTAGSAAGRTMLLSGTVNAFAWTVLFDEVAGVKAFANPEFAGMALLGVVVRAVCVGCGGCGSRAGGGSGRRTSGNVTTGTGTYCTWFGPTAPAASTEPAPSGVRLPLTLPSGLSWPVAIFMTLMPSLEAGLAAV